jgi:hypothetical protein
MGSPVQAHTLGAQKYFDVPAVNHQVRPVQIGLSNRMDPVFGVGNQIPPADRLSAIKTGDWHSSSLSLKFALQSAIVPAYLAFVMQVLKL